ncbi:MAG TPA: hypothetical protein VKM55_20215 [Candidatus Lokiarchaeia archaeon]|nr:hypothetical protein [Candidatus Lokiarchaeia archaeon]
MVSSREHPDQGSAKGSYAGGKNMPLATRSLINPDTVEIHVPVVSKHF